MKQFVFFIFFSCGISCTSPNKIPDDVMGINEMKPIVWDMMRAGVLAQNQFRLDTARLKKETMLNYEQALKIYGITKDEFYHSYNYYLENPDKNKILMDSIVAYSNRKRVDLFEKERLK
ncbi:MAG: DUF4296 domain-containing protein [Panacibacter sp.]